MYFVFKGVTYLFNLNLGRSKFIISGNKNKTTLSNLYLNT